MVEPRSKSYETQGKTLLQDALGDSDTTALKKYQAINVGSFRLWDLIKYELYTMFVAPVPGALGYVLRKFFLKRMLGTCGRGVIVGRNVTLRHPAKIHLGDQVAIDDYAVIDAKGDSNRGIDIADNVLIGRGTVLSCKNGDLSIGECSNIAMACFIQSASRVRVGSKVLFGAYCYVIGGGDHVASRTDVPIMDQGQTIKGIDIGDNVWLGADVKVVDGVTIGRDAVLGAGSVANRDVPAFGVAAGVPARLIKDRREAAEGGS